MVIQYSLTTAEAKLATLYSQSVFKEKVLISV